MKKIEIANRCWDCKFFSESEYETCILYEEEIRIRAIDGKPAWCKAKRVIVEEIGDDSGASKIKPTKIPNDGILQRW